MITEDYVSYETAKLLKENGFENDAISCINVFKGHTYKIQDRVIDVDDDITIPTIQMAMKWLRKVYHIDIEVRTHYLNRLKPNDIRYYSGKILKDSEDVIYTIYSKDTYEEVCEEAIKYCLENLI